jgi:hypothetical protein
VSEAAHPQQMIRLGSHALHAPLATRFAWHRHVRDDRSGGPLTCASVGKEGSGSSTESTVPALFRILARTTALLAAADHQQGWRCRIRGDPIICAGAVARLPLAGASNGDGTVDPPAVEGFGRPFRRARVCRLPTIHVWPVRESGSRPGGRRVPFPHGSSHERAVADVAETAPVGQQGPRWRSGRSRADWCNAATGLPRPSARGA